MRRLQGLLALLGIVAIVAGVPWLLLAIGASPVPDTFSVPALWDAVRQPADGTVFRSLFTYAAWLGWLFFTACLVVEVLARLLGTDPPELPGLSLPQGMARSLVGAAALLFVAAPVLTSTASAAGAAPGGASALATASSATSVGSEAAAAHALAQGSAEAGDDAISEAAGPSVETRTHTVAQGETLWSIAEQHLGDGTRYAEILELNPSISSHWITPGTDLQIPDEAPEPTVEHQREVVAGDTLWDIAEDELGDGSRYDEIAVATADTDQPGGERLTDPDLIKPGWQVTIPGQAPGDDGRASAATSSTATDRSAQGADGTVTDQAETSAEAGAGSAVEVTAAAVGGGAATALDAATTDEGSQTTDDPVIVADPEQGWAGTAIGLGALTAAGVVSLLSAARRRAVRQGRRSSGSGPVEDALRLVADGHSRDTVDLALRDIARAAAEQQQPVPGLRTVRLTPERIDVQLEHPVRLSAPWTSTADPRVWTLAADRVRGLDTLTLASLPAPYPTLVSLGTDTEDAHVLVNLAHAHTFAVVGEQHTTRAVVAAMGLDLTSSPWAQQTTVTVIGGDPALVQAIGSPRLRHVADASAYFVAESVTTATTAREVVLVSGELTPEDHARLARSAASSPRIALVHATDRAEGHTWSLEVGAEPDAAVLAPAHLQLRAQRADDEAVAGIVELFQLARQSESYWAPHDEPTLATVGAAAAAMGSPGIVVDESGAVVASSDDDLPTQRHADTITAARRVPLRWNTPVRSTTGGATDEDTAALVETVRRATDSSWTATASTPRWLSNQITPTPGVPVPPVIAFPLRDPDVASSIDGPVLRLLGPVDIDDAPPVRESHRTRLTELAAYLCLHPDATDAEIDDAMWPNRSSHDHARVRLGALAALGDWLGTGGLSPHDLTGAPEAGRAAAAALVSDWSLWQQLLPEGAAGASSSRLEQALGLVRARPFVGARSRHYVWASALRTQMTEAICGAAAELARRRVLEGRWSSAYDATVIGLTVEPHAEPLWRLQVLAAHELDDDLLDEALAGLRELGGRDDADLDSASTRLLDDIDLRDTVQPARVVG